MTQWEIEPEAVSAAATKIADTATAITGDQDALSAASVRLDAQWNGAAAVAYSSAHAIWAAECTRVNGVLADAAIAAQTCADAYADADRRVGALWGM